MSSIGQMIVPLPTTNPTGLGSYVDPVNTDPAVNTTAGSLNANTKGILQEIQSTDPVQTYQSNSYAHLTSGTTTVKTGAGTLASLIVNSPGTTVTATIYDNTAGSGTVIAIVLLAAGMNLTYNVEVGVGITVVLSGACDVTVGYR